MNQTNSSRQFIATVVSLLFFALVLWVASPLFKRQPEPKGVVQQEQKLPEPQTELNWTMLRMDILHRELYEEMDQPTLAQLFIKIDLLRRTQEDNPEWSVHTGIVAESLARFDKKGVEQWETAATYFAQAIEEYDKLSQTASSARQDDFRRRTAQIQLYLGNALGKQGKIEEAIKVYWKATMRDHMVQAQVTHAVEELEKKKK